MIPLTESLMMQRDRSLRSVATALNVVFGDDEERSLKRAKPDPSGVQIRFFPNRKLVIAVQNQIRTGDLNAVAHQLTEHALAALSEPARQDCRLALLSWVGHDGTAPTAAVDLAVSGGPTVVGSSWKPRHLWIRPMPDPDMSPESALDESIKLVQSEVNRALADAKHESKDVRGALRLCEKCFLWAHGVAPANVSSFPEDAKRWPAWLADFLRAAEAEQIRLFPKYLAGADLAAPPALSDKITEIRIFLSYAMPTNVEVAMPIKRALESHGASVWFDQTKRPSESNLDQGLQGVIRNQNVFLLCASHELFENAGYALQELAWALDLQENGSWPGVICGRGARRCINR